MREARGKVFKELRRAKRATTEFSWGMGRECQHNGFSISMSR
jgi:hypothetical protein